MEQDALKRDYENLYQLAFRFCNELTNQVKSILDRELISLAVPIESRVKSWNSITEKLKRRELAVDTLQQLTDFIGLRIILLFQRDVKRTTDVISNTFEILEKEDTFDRLGEDQFGYRSIHLIVKLPKEWLRVPGLSSFGDLLAEIQIRTAAQHIWAASSHLLQYKHETSVPTSLRRTIYRVSALLETVDLEFERLIKLRDEYRGEVAIPDKNSTLDTDILESILDKMLPSNNKVSSEPYAELLDDLHAFDISTVADLQELLSKHKNKMIEQDAKRAEQERKDKVTISTLDETSKKRIEMGIYFTHVGLVRMALICEFGKRYDIYQRKMSTKNK